MARINPRKIKGGWLDGYALVDDLYRSGATLNAVTEAVLTSGASSVYALALTQTRKKV